MALLGLLGLPSGIVIEVLAQVRPATAQDAEELIRLRVVMLTAMRGAAPEPGPWRQIAVESLTTRLAAAQARLGAFVVPATDSVPGALAACALGTIESRLGNPDNPSGETGYVFNAR